MYALARKLVPWLLLALIALLFGYALSAGSLNLSAKESWAVVLNHLGLTHIEGVGKVNQLVVWDIRLPRLMLAMLSGAALAGAGMVYQGVFRNPLVEPYLLGISSGAALGASLSIVFPMIFTDGQLTSFLFSLGAVSITYLLAHDRKTASTPPVALILSGVLVGALSLIHISEPTRPY